MTPLYTVLMCIPAGLALITCACGLAVLWRPPTRSAERGGEVQNALCSSYTFMGGAPENRRDRGVAHR